MQPTDEEAVDDACQLEHVGHDLLAQRVAAQRLALRVGRPVGRVVDGQAAVCVAILMAAWPLGRRRILLVARRVCLQALPLGADILVSMVRAGEEGPGEVFKHDHDDDAKHYAAWSRRVVEHLSEVIRSIGDDMDESQ